VFPTEEESGMLMVCTYRIPVLAGGWVMGERAIEEGYRGPEMGQLALSKGLARMGIRCHILYKELPFHIRGLFLSKQ
jgi:hypothetical protein